MNSKHDNSGETGMSELVENYINEAKHAAENELNGDESMGAVDLNVEDGKSDNVELDDLDLDEEDSEDDLEDGDEGDLDNEDDSEEEFDEDDDDTDNASDDDDDLDEEDSDSDDLDASDDEESDDHDNDDSDEEFDEDDNSEEDDEDTEVNSSEENVPDDEEHEDLHVEEDTGEVETDETYDVQEEISGEMTDLPVDDDLYDDSDKAVSIAISEEEDVSGESGVENNMQDIINAAGSMAEPVKRQRAIKKKSVPKDVIKGINVDLTFETARQSISLGELSAIKEGYTFVSPNPVTSLIDVRANGKLIGHGRLVNVDGRIGVQITEIL